MTDLAISFNGVSFFYRGASSPIISIKELNIKKGEAVLIKGPSGCGKSTLINLISGILKVSSGTLSILGCEIGLLSNLKRDQYRGQNIGIIFQQFNLVPYLTARENVYLPLKFGTLGKLEKLRDAQLLETIQERFKSLMRGLNMDKFEKTPAHDLSLGMQQRIAAARALLVSKEIILADEPTSSLDKKNADELLGFLFKEVKESQKTLVVVSHDARIESFFDHVINLPDINYTYSSAGTG